MKKKKGKEVTEESNSVCFKCGNIGHYKRNCNTLKYKNKQEGIRKCQKGIKDSKNSVCFGCGKIGHFKKKCYPLKYKNKQAAILKEEKNSNVMPTWSDDFSSKNGKINDMGIDDCVHENTELESSDSDDNSNELDLKADMGSKGRIPPQQLRRPLPGPSVGHADAYGPRLLPSRGAIPPFEMPPPDVMEQKLAAQHVDMQKLATENKRLAATHGTLRHELAAAQHELQLLRSHMGAVESGTEHQARSLKDRIARMEADLQSAEPLKLELQKAQSEAQELFLERQELVSKAQVMTQDLQKAHADMQQFHVLMSELENFRQEYQHCRATYDYEKKLCSDHLESLQVMEKNYITMAREVEKLQAELTNSANVDRRTGIPYGGATGYNENDASGHYPVGQNAYSEAYGLHQGHGPLPGGSASGASGSAGAAPAAIPPVAPAAAGGGTPNPGDKSGVPPVRPGYDAQRGVTYDVQRGSSGSGYDTQRIGGPGYDAQRGYGGPGYDPQRGPSAPGYDMQRSQGLPGYDSQRGASGPGFDPQRGPVGPTYDPQRGAGYDMQRGPGYDAQRGPVYDAQAAHWK